MRKVLDANCFQHPCLEAYLRSSPDNYVVFTDFACMEMYKPTSLDSIHKSLGIVSRYPSQVLVLKPTPEIIALQNSDPHLSADDFVDLDQTRGFAQFCDGVRRAVEGDHDLQRQIQEHRAEALHHFDKMLVEAETYSEGVAALRASLRPDHVRALRDRAPLSADDAQEMIRMILLLAGTMFGNHPEVTHLPKPFSAAAKTHIFRMALSGYLLTTRWIADGGATGVRRDRLRNDVVDITYVAFATRFDDLLSLDKKVVELHEEARFIVDEVIGKEPLAPDTGFAP